MVVAGLLVRSAVTDDPEPGPAARTQRTLLLQIRGKANLARSSVLLAHDPADGRSSMTFIPPGVLAQAPGLGTVPFEEALQLRGVAASRGALADLLGVTVDQDWTLSEAGLVSLIDRLGGIRADVDVDGVVPAGGGRNVLVVSPGPDQELDGSRALTFATYLAPGEDQLGSFPRLQQVLEGILDKIESPAALATILQATSRAGPSSLPPPRLAELLADIAESERADELSVATLPVVPIDSGAPRLRYRLDEVPALELVKRVLAESVPPGRFEGDKRVILQNGVGSPALTTTAQQKLSAAGFDIVRTGNANRFDYATSVILVKDATAASNALGAEVARALGLRVSAVRVNSQRNSVTDVIVILGRDFKR
ncbi:MAG TPA: LCP family protein [Mycobacteriales bacterium]|nr:LCP family protein [Mycobacteriales bacterium]